MKQHPHNPRRTVADAATVVGIRELKARTSEIVSEVREQQAEYVVTHRGEPVGILLPYRPSLSEPVQQNPDTGPAVWQRLEELGAQIAAHWQGPGDSIDALNEIRSRNP